MHTYHLVDKLVVARRGKPVMARVPPDEAVAPHEQCTTSITLGELLFGARRKGSDTLERSGRRLAEPDLRIASIALSRDLTLVTGNVRHLARVPDLRIEDWLLT